MHPTVKPVALVADAILDCSKRGGIVLDCFGGSGTTLIAAEKTGRRGYVMELDPAYVDVTIRGSRNLLEKRRSTSKPPHFRRHCERERTARSPRPRTVLRRREENQMSNDYRGRLQKATPAFAGSRRASRAIPRAGPSGTKNLKTDLTEELQEKITVREGARASQISKQRAIVKTLVAKTLKGDARAATTLTTMIYRVLGPDDEAADPEAPLTADEAEIVAEILKQERQRQAGPARRTPSKADPGESQS